MWPAWLAAALVLLGGVVAWRLDEQGKQDRREQNSCELFTPGDC